MVPDARDPAQARSGATERAPGGPPALAWRAELGSALDRAQLLDTFSEARVLKAERRTTILLLPRTPLADGQPQGPCVLKVYRYPGWSRLRTWARLPKAEREARALGLCARLGVPAAVPLAWGSQRDTLGLVRSCHLITSFEPGTMSLRTWLRERRFERPGGGERLAAWLQALGRGLRRLHAQRFFIRTTSVKNVLVREEGPADSAWLLIDMPYARHLPRGPLAALGQRRDLGALTASLVRHVGEDPLAHFYAAYLPDPLGGSEAMLRLRALRGTRRRRRGSPLRRARRLTRRLLGWPRAGWARRDLEPGRPSANSRPATPGRRDSGDGRSPSPRGPQPATLAAEGVPMKLYTFPIAPNPTRLRLYLAEKAAAGHPISLEEVTVNLPEGEQRTPEHRARNPLGALPVLELPDGSFLTESLAIIEYLEELHPEPPLLGREPLARARVRELERIAELGVLWPAAHVVHTTRSPLGLPANPEVAALFRRRLQEPLRVFDARLADGRPFLAGPDVTIADCTLAAALQFGRFGEVDLALPEERPHVAAWDARYRERPAARSVLLR